MHISDIKNYLRCPRLYQLSLQDEYRPFPFFNINIDVDDSIRKKLDVNRFYEGIANDNNEKTLRAFQDYDWLVKCRFVYRGLRVRVPLLWHDGNECKVYFSYLSVAPSEGELTNIKWTCSVMEALGFVIKGIYLVHLNPEYIRHGELNHKKLWIISDSFYNDNGNPTRNVLEAYHKSRFNLDAALDEFLHFDFEEDDDTVVKRTNKCTGRSKCRYYDICFPEESDLPDNSILNLVSSQYKYEMFNSGIRYLSDIDLSFFEGSQQQYAQIMADKKGGLYYEPLALSKWLETNTSEPMSFFDFEWDLFPFPPYDEMGVMQVLCFQYSLHIERDGQIEHRQFIGRGDCRRRFVEQLIEEVPKEGVIFAYNAKGAEIIRLRELQRVFPEYHDPLEQIIERVVDLATPFIKGMVYDVRMRGLYSLKVIQEMLDKDYTYKDLEVGNGLEAVAIYRKIQQEKDPEVINKYYEELYKYCGLDSYAMVEVYHWLKELIKP